MTKERQQHNFRGLLFTIVVLILVLAGGARGHNRREQDRDNATIKASLVNVIEPTALAPSISGISALVQDVESNKSVFDLNSSTQWSAASLTKLVTSVVALENLKADQMIRVSPTAIATESSAGNLVAGKYYPLSELLRVMMVFSSNDAAVAIAEHFGKENFIGLMNKKTADIGMADTRLFDSSGLSPLDLTTAGDLNRLLTYIFKKHPDLLALSREKIEGATHPFAGEPDFIGGKTGFIDEAGGNLISLFNYQGRAVAIIVLGSRQRAEDTKILKDWFLH